MGFRLASGLAGFAKRGMQFNDEQRQLLNENIKSSVALVTTDIMEQRKARKATKLAYMKTANALKPHLSNVQIEAAYQQYGDDAPAKIQELIKDGQIQNELYNKQHGTNQLFSSSSYLNSMFSDQPGAVGRTIPEQAQAYTDANMPLTTMNTSAIARNLAESSGEISMRPRSGQAASIEKQMAGMMQAAGGATESAPAVFNPSGMTFTPKATQAEILAREREIAATGTAQSQQTIAEAEAGTAEEMAGAKLDTIQQDLLTKKLSYDQLVRTNPLLEQQLRTQISSDNIQNIILRATQDDKIAQAELTTAIQKIQKEAGELDITRTEMGIAQDEKLFPEQVKQLQLQIAGMESDNVVKAVTAGDASVMAEMNKELKLIQLEQGSLRTSLLTEEANRAGTQTELLDQQLQKAQNENSLFGLQEETLRSRLDLIRAQVKNANTPTTYQAAILEIDQAIMQTDPSDPEYDTLQAEKDYMIASLGMYTDTTATEKASTDPKFPSLISGYNSALKTKLNQAGMGGNVVFLTDGSVKWEGSPQARVAFDALVARHQGSFYGAIMEFEQGPAALQALNIEFEALDYKEIPSGPGGTFDSVPDLKPTDLNKVFIDPQRGVVQIVRDSRGRLALDTL